MIVGILKAMLTGPRGQNNFSSRFTPAELMKIHKPSDKLRESIGKTHTFMIEAADFIEAYCAGTPKTTMDVILGGTQAECVPCLLHGNPPLSARESLRELYIEQMHES